MDGLKLLKLIIKYSPVRFSLAQQSTGLGFSKKIIKLNFFFELDMRNLGTIVRYQCCGERENNQPSNRKFISQTS